METANLVYLSQSLEIFYRGGYNIVSSTKLIVAKQFYSIARMTKA